MTFLADLPQGLISRLQPAQNGTQEQQSIEQGQTIEQVEKALGPPTQMFKAGGKQIYVYKVFKLVRQLDKRSPKERFPFKLDRRYCLSAETPLAEMVLLPEPALATASAWAPVTFRSSCRE